MDTCILVALDTPVYSSKWNVEDSLDELKQLAYTAGYMAQHVVTQKRQTPHPTYFIGEGKLGELKIVVQDTGIQLVIFDDDLSPAQSKHLEEALRVKVMDRTGLILDIFATHARTSEAKLQVEKAQLEYLLPRLTRLWTHLSRLGGGIGTRGPGEKQLESDKRQIKVRIETIKDKLQKITSHRSVMRHHRLEVPLLSGAIIGYTNAGKSSLLNAITAANVLAQDKLFATLDPTSKRLQLPNKDTVVLTDTVGFIQKLPHQLVSSFRSTLEEVKEADFLVHVVDISHPKYPVFIQTAHDILADLKADHLPQLYVFNKIDLLQDNSELERAKHLFYPNVFISATKGQHLDSLLEAFMQILPANRSRFEFKLTFQEMGWVSLLHDIADIHTQTYLEDGVMIEATLQTILGEKILNALCIKPK